MSEVNKAILLTPAGVGAIAVVRLVGPATSGFLKKYFSTPIENGKAIHGQLKDRDRTIDDPVIVGLANGADVNLHGGAWVVREMLELARREGFTVIDRGELPLPPEAVDSRDLLEQEVLQYLPLARTELAIRALLAQPQAWNDIQNQQSKIQNILSDQSLHWLLHPPRVALVGIANSGKSTLANQLFAQQRSITADVPGTTRDWVGEIANLDGLAVMLVDTPGLRDTPDEIERIAIGRSREQIQKADLVVLVLDRTVALESEQAKLIADHPDALRVANKADRPGAWKEQCIGAMPVVATRGQGVDLLRQAIRKRFHCEEIDLHKARCWTDRQRNLLKGLMGPARDKE